jgi:hypothetical protein
MTIDYLKSMKLPMPARADLLRLAINDNWSRLQRETFAPRIIVLCYTHKR